MKPMQRLFDTVRLDLWGPLLLDFSGRTLTAILLVLVGWWVASQLGNWLRRTIVRRGGDRVLADFLKRVVFIAVMVMTIVAALDRIGVPTASLLAALGAAGLAIGLAMRDSLSNLAAGVLLVVTRPFRAGDFIAVGAFSGRVERIDLLQTVLASADNKVIAVPNGLLMSQPIVNMTARDQRMIDLALTIDYASDPGPIVDGLRNALAEQPLVLAEPAPQVVLTRFGENGLELALRAWVKTADLIRAQSDLIALARSCIDAAGGQLATAPRPTGEVAKRG